ncbi:Solitary outer membrane autotransporter beta-barrel domain [Shewanella algidipiscicola]|uniref:Solitary outer membrane autotransporter beta-barrel domain n=1 Tax=Shewanella algidipiscicola TaxID=614070 RepID=UPI001EF6DE5D|nr:Solitary outer membrane autotransporter beta-barrel domain [Shewanella algidipiscicola]
MALDVDEVQLIHRWLIGGIMLRCLTTLGLILIGWSLSASEVEEAVRRVVEAKVSGDVTSAIVLTDANLITLGIVDFDPNAFIDVGAIGDINVGDADSLRRRSQLRNYSLPWESQPRELDRDWLVSSAVQFSYVHSNDNIIGIDDPSLISPIEDTIYLLAAEYRWRYHLSPRWQVVFGAGGQLLWLENNLEYRDPILASQRALLDGIIVNTRYGAVMVDPNVEFTYTSELFGHKWEFISAFRYAYGRTVLTDNGAQSVSPEVSRFSNTLIFHYGLPSVWSRRNELILQVKRVDLSGDVVDPMGTRYYYELGAGWIIETPSLAAWIENIGLGITLNINSGLSGGGLVLLFNEPL